MANWKEWLFRLGVLVAIALAATVIALLFQTYYGHRELFAALGQVLAIFGAVIFALWLLKAIQWSALNESTAPGDLLDVSSTPSGLA